MTDANGKWTMENYGLSSADICKKYGFVAGDVIEGVDCGLTRLALQWVGDTVVVAVVYRHNEKTGEWTCDGESASWSLAFREWKKVEEEQV